jgi:hypothetical protein
LRDRILLSRIRKRELKTALHFIQMFRMNSAYALEETRLNLAADRSEDVPRLNWLLGSISTVGAPQGLELPDTVQLDPKDQQILLAAIDPKAGYL